MDLKQHIRNVPDFPKAGILFYDITTLLRDPQGFRALLPHSFTVFDALSRRSMRTRDLPPLRRPYRRAPDGPAAFAGPPTRPTAPPGGRNAGGVHEENGTLPAGLTGG